MKTQRSRFLLLQLFLIPDAVFFGDRPQHLTGVAHGHHAGGNILCDHAACTDDRVGADGDPGQDGDITAQPDVVPQCDGGCGLKAAVALFRQHGVDGSVHAAVEADEAVPAQCDFCAVHQVSTVVDVGARTDEAVIAVIHIQVRQNDHMFFHVGQQLT